MAAEHEGYAFLPPLGEVQALPEFGGLFRHLAALLGPPRQHAPGRAPGSPSRRALLERVGAGQSESEHGSEKYGGDSTDVHGVNRKELVEVLLVWLDRERELLRKETEARLREVYAAPAAERRAAVELQRLKWHAFVDALRLVEGAVRDGGGPGEAPQEADAKALAALHFLAQWEQGTTRDKVRALRAILEMYGVSPPRSDTFVDEEGGGGAGEDAMREQLNQLRRRFVVSFPGGGASSGGDELQLYGGLLERARRAAERDCSLVAGLVEEIRDLRDRAAGDQTKEELAEFEAKLSRIEGLLKLKEDELQAHVKATGKDRHHFWSNFFTHAKSRQAALEHEQVELQARGLEVVRQRRDAIVAAQRLQTGAGSLPEAQVRQLEQRARVGRRAHEEAESDLRDRRAEENFRRAEELLEAVNSFAAHAAESELHPPGSAGGMDSPKGKGILKNRVLLETHRAHQIETAATAAIRRAQLLQTTNEQRAEAHRANLLSDLDRQRANDARLLLERHATGVFAASQRDRGDVQASKPLDLGPGPGHDDFAARWTREMGNAANKAQASDRQKREVDVKVETALKADAIEISKAFGGDHAERRPETVKVKLVLQGMRKKDIKDQAGFETHMKDQLQSTLQLRQSQLKVRISD